MDPHFSPSDSTFSFKKIDEHKWQVLVSGEWNAATQKNLLKKLSQVGAHSDFSYFKIEEGGRFPASGDNKEGEEVFVEFSHLNSPDFFYSVDGILERPLPKTEPIPLVHRRAREY